MQQNILKKKNIFLVIKYNQDIFGIIYKINLFTEYQTYKLIQIKYNQKSKLNRLIRIWSSQNILIYWNKWLTGNEIIMNWIFKLCNLINMKNCKNKNNLFINRN